MSGSLVRSVASTAMPLSMRQPGRCGKCGVRHGADADDDEIGLDRLAVGERDARRSAAVVVDRRDARADRMVDAFARDGARAMTRGDLRRHAAHQDARLRLDDRDRGAALARAGRELQADEAAADDGDAAAGPRCGADRERVVEGAQIDAARSDGPAAAAGAASRRSPAAACRRASARAVGERTVLRRAVDRRRPRPAMDRCRALGETLVAGDRSSASARLADHRVLGQRRPLVGQMRLVADQRDRAVIADLAQRKRGARAAFAGADDDHARCASPSVRSRSSDFAGLDLHRIGLRG